MMLLMSPLMKDDKLLNLIGLKRKNIPADL